MTLSARLFAAAAASAATPVVALAAPASALEPAGGDAASIANLLWWMAFGAGLIWLAAMAFLIYCLVGARAGYAPPRPSRVAVGGGVLLPVVLLAILLAVTWPLIETALGGAPTSAQPQVTVVGEQ